MTSSVFTLSVETTIYPAFQAPYHVGTDERIARQCAEECFQNRKWFAGYGRVTIRTVALMRDGRVFDVYDGEWMSDVQERDMAEQEAAPADRLPSALAFIPSANLRNMLTFFRDQRDHVAVRLIDTELFYRQPIVTHDCGYGHWMATRGDYDLDCLVGTGRTEAEAIDMLVDWEADHRARYDALPVEYDDGGMAEERARHP